MSSNSLAWHRKRAKNNDYYGFYSVFLALEVPGAANRPKLLPWQVICLERVDYPPHQLGRGETCILAKGDAASRIGQAVYWQQTIARYQQINPLGGSVVACYFGRSRQCDIVVHFAGIQSDSGHWARLAPGAVTMSRPPQFQIHNFESDSQFREGFPVTKRKIVQLTSNLIIKFVIV